MARRSPRPDRHAAERPEAREWARALCLEYVAEAYANWRRYCDRMREAGLGRAAWKAEPKITPSLLRGYLDQHGGQPSWWLMAGRRRRDSMVRSILASEVRRGTLTTSLGSGLNGTETRLYEPATTEEL